MSLVTFAAERAMVFGLVAEVREKLLEVPSVALLVVVLVPLCVGVCAWCLLATVSCRGPPRQNFAGLACVSAEVRSEDGCLYLSLRRLFSRA